MKKNNCWIEDYEMRDLNPKEEKYYQESLEKMSENTMESFYDVINNGGDNPYGG